MKPKHALVALVGVLTVLNFILSFLDARGIAELKSLQIGSTLAFSALTFAWFWLDSEARRYRRSPFLSIAIVALGFICTVLLGSKSSQWRATQGNHKIPGVRIAVDRRARYWKPPGLLAWPVRMTQHLFLCGPWVPAGAASPGLI